MGGANKCSAVPIQQIRHGSSDIGPVLFKTHDQLVEVDTVQYLIILVNAKQLGSRYFEGITIDNVVQLHSYLIGLGVVQFSLKELMKGECTDIDFKKEI